MDINGLAIRVDEASDELCYTFTQVESALGPQPGFPLGTIIGFLGLPVFIAGIMTYCLGSAGTGLPWWQVGLAGLLIAQMVFIALWSWAGPIAMNLRLWSDYGRPTVLRFTPQLCIHGGYGGERSVCELNMVRGVQLFAFEVETDFLEGKPRAEPAPGESPRMSPQASLSLVIGDDHLTHGLFGWFDPESLIVLAEDITRRLTKFRAEQGLQPADPVSVVHTIPEEVDTLAHTYTDVVLDGGFMALIRRACRAVLFNRVPNLLWCVAALAAFVGSFRLVQITDMNPVLRIVTLFALGLMGFVHAVLLWKSLNGELKQLGNPG